MKSDSETKEVIMNVILDLESHTCCMIGCHLYHIYTHRFRTVYISTAHSLQK